MLIRSQVRVASLKFLLRKLGLGPPACRTKRPWPASSPRRCRVSGLGLRAEGSRFQKYRMGKLAHQKSLNRQNEVRKHVMHAVPSPCPNASSEPSTETQHRTSQKGEQQCQCTRIHNITFLPAGPRALSKKSIQRMLQTPGASTLKLYNSTTCIFLTLAIIPKSKILRLQAYLKP